MTGPKRVIDEYFAEETDVERSIAEILWDEGYVSFYAMKDGAIDFVGPYVIAIDDGGYWILKTIVDYNISTLKLQYYSDRLSEIRQKIYDRPSAFDGGREYDCGYAIYHVETEEWYYCPYSQQSVEDVTEHKKLLEVV
jgi:hypothetical protein